MMVMLAGTIRRVDMCQPDTGEDYTALGSAHGQDHACVAHWNILAAGKLVTRQVLLPTQREHHYTPASAGLLLGLLARRYVLSKSLMTRRRGCHVPFGGGVST